MVGVDHPLVPMVHHFLVTEDVPQVAAIEGDMAAVTDLEGFTYLQREGNGVLLGVYEQNPRHWAVEGAPWDFGRAALPRGARAHHARALDRVRALPRAAGRRDQAVGERRVHVHPRREPAGRPGRGHPELLGGVRRAWPGSPSARGSGSPWRTGSSTATPATTCSAWTSRASVPTPRTTRYLRETTAQFYARRFVMAYPNEELPAARPLEDHAVLRRVPGGGRAVHRELGSRGAAVLRALARLRGERHARPVERRADRRARRSRRSAPRPARTRSPSTPATR